jgi:hypothetical protein
MSSLIYKVEKRQYGDANTVTLLQQLGLVLDLLLKSDPEGLTWEV